MPTFDSMLCATGNLPKHDLSFERSEHDHTKFDYVTVSNQYNLQDLQ